jgi:hypothetical protein
VTVEIAQAMTTTQAMTKPDPPQFTPYLPARNGPKGLVPATWLQRTVRISHTAADGSERESRGTLIDLYPFGPVVNILGSKTMISWDRLAVLELIED